VVLLTMADRTEKVKEDFGGALGMSAGVGSNAGCVANFVDACILLAFSFDIGGSFVVSFPADD
jgi:hypothetical protein